MTGIRDPLGKDIFRRIPEIDQLTTRDHPCLIYETGEDLKKSFVPYLQSGLKAGERCIYFINENTPEFVIEAMSEKAFALKGYLDSGAFRIIHTRDAHLKDGYFEEQKMLDYWTNSIKEAKAYGFSGLRAAVEMTWALSGMPGCQHLAPYESRLNRFVESNPVTVICQYRRGKFSPEQLKSVAHAHPIIVKDAEVLENPAMIAPEEFEEGCAELEFRHMLDNLALIKQLNVTYQALEQAYAELHHLSYVLSHELQEPLSTIKSYQNLLSARYKGRLGEDADSFIERCNRASLTVAKMIDDLWAYARVQKPTQLFSVFDANGALKSAVSRLTKQIEAGNATITSDRMPLIYGLESQVSDVFARIIDNSLKFCPGKPEIKVTAEADGDFWRFAIEDNGPGIDSIHSRDVFKLFHRLGRRPDQEGTGMGLCICQKVVEYHNGRIWIDTEHKSGARICFTLPGTNANVTQARLEQPI